MSQSQKLKLREKPRLKRNGKNRDWKSWGVYNDRDSGCGDFEGDGN
jgi:hypothetical protein